TLVVNVDGSYTFTLNAPIVNAAGSATGNEENTSLAFGLTVTDGDGDTAAATLTVQGNDDTPVGHTGAPTTIPDDGAQTIFTPVNPGAVGTGDVTPDTPTVSGVAGALFTAGADGLKSVALSTPPAFDVIYKASNGLALTESVTWGAGSVNATTGATTFTATSAHYAGGAATLVVTVDGSYTFTLNAPIVNAAGSATGNEENTSLAFGLTVTDGDGDTAAATLTVQVNDDTPVGHTVAPTTILDDEAQTIFTPVNPGAVGTGDVTPDTPTVSGVAGALFTAGADGLKSVALSTPPAFDVIYKASN